jgi:hypothetical protein
MHFRDELKLKKKISNDLHHAILAAMSNIEVPLRTT